MSSARRLDVSPGPQIRATPGAYPPTPGEPDQPNLVSSELSLSQAVYARRAEYTISKKIRIKVGTWNVASISGTEKDIGPWFVGGKGLSESLSALHFEDEETVSDGSLEDVGHQESRRRKKKPTVPLNDPGLLPGDEEIGLYVLGLQEIIDVGSATQALKPYHDPHPSRRWKHAIENALPEGYALVAEQQLVGLYMVIYAAPNVATTVSSVSTASVGTGLMGYMGNKGAVVTRIVLGESTRIVFVDCHLGAGAEDGSLERRNWDVSQILRRTTFDAVYNGGGEKEEDSEKIGSEDFAFWFGDLNYRLEGIPGEDVRRLLMLHTKDLYREGEESRRKIDAELALHNRYLDHDPTEDSTSSNHHDASSMATSLASDLDPSSDPASLQTTISSLLPHDQLHQQMHERKAFHDGWREGPIDFLPTYKYDVGSVGMYDSSEKKRGPSWCDRILFRTQRDKSNHEEEVQAEEAAKKRDQEMKAHGLDDTSINDEEVLFDYDPAADGTNDDYDEHADDPEVTTNAAGFDDKLHLEYYTSHQRVLSSDHKPLDAIFTLTYAAADPDLKAKVHKEVARELDVAENERRPAVTVIVDHHQDHSHPSQDHESVDFGEVRFDSPKTQNITIANTGRATAVAGFTDRIVSANQPAGTAPPWLRIRFDRPSDKNPPESYTLEPGDAVNVELTVHVTDMALVRQLNNNETHLEDVLVLRIHNGRDYFLPVRATWLASSFGRSIGNLVRIPEGGVRKAQDQQESGVKWSAPRELFRLTESLEDLVERAVAEWGMKVHEEDTEKAPWAREPRWPFSSDYHPTSEEDSRQVLKERIRETLDTDAPISSAFPMETTILQRAECVAETFLSFLHNLEDGIITESLWSDLEKMLLEREKDRAKTQLSIEDERMQILDILIRSPAHSTSFTFVTTMLTKIIHELRGAGTEAEQRRTGLEGSFATMFSDLVIRAPTYTNIKDRRASNARQNRVLEVFLHG
ncbi:MAG: hypothetical protein Q9222_007491 [Ikaeria aurantiellina]